MHITRKYNIEHFYHIDMLKYIMISCTISFFSTIVRNDGSIPFWNPVFQLALREKLPWTFSWITYNR